MEKFGRFERAANKLIRDVKSLGPPNVAEMKEDGILGDEFEKARLHLLRSPMRERQLTRQVRALCRELGLQPRKYGLYSHRWGGQYRKFINHIKVNAAKERKKRLG
jgi:hypothetical protein